MIEKELCILRNDNLPVKCYIFDVDCQNIENIFEMKDAKYVNSNLHKKSWQRLLYGISNRVRLVILCYKCVT